MSAALKRYFLEYQREFSDYKSVSSLPELIRATETASILLCGDYHTLPEAQRAGLQLAEAVYRTGRPLVLALELVETHHQPSVDRYFLGEIDEAQLLKEIRYKSHWGFQWSHYRPFFEFARSHGVRVVGLSPRRLKPSVSLKRRDAHAARVLVREAGLSPDGLVMAIMGDLHLAGTHLPAEIRAVQKKRVSVVVVHQNREALYWKLAARKIEHQGLVLKLRRDVYCLMNTPPWFKLQSYLNWLESGANPSGERQDLEEDFYLLVQNLLKFLKVNKPIQDAYEIVWRKGPKKSHSLAGELGNFVDVERKQVLLSSTHLNVATTQSAVLVHAVLSDRKWNFRFPRQDFYGTVWVEALGYFGSKLVNPHRKSHSLSDFKAADQRDALVKWVAHFSEAVSHFLKSGRFLGVPLPPRAVPLARQVFYYRAAKCIGQALGDQLYDACVADRIQPKEVRRLFESADTQGHAAQSLYLNWVMRLESTGDASG
jgi:uncharacterized iron-regulated protein